MLCNKLDSGFIYAIKENTSQVAHCALSIKWGTRYESNFSSGIAHFCEHTIFKGTKNKKASVINGYLDKYGGEINAYTSKEEIVIHSTVLNKDLKKAIKLILELASQANFPQKEIDIERNVIIEEINSYKDSPADSIYDLFEEKLFEGHPLSKPILGDDKSIKNINSKDLQEFIKQGFRPERMALTIVSGHKPKQMESFILKEFETYFPSTSFSNNSPKIDYSTSSLSESGLKLSDISSRLSDSSARLSDSSSKFDIPQNIFNITKNEDNYEANAIIGCLAPSLYDEKERHIAVLLSNIIGGPSSNSMLNKSLRERHGWVYSVECSYTQYSDTGIIAICLGCDKNNLNNCFKEIYKTLKKLQDKPLSDRFLDSAKRQLIGQLIISTDNQESNCLAMGKVLLSYGKLRDFEEVKNTISNISAKDIQEFALKTFPKAKLSTMIFT